MLPRVTFEMATKEGSGHPRPFTYDRDFSTTPVLTTCEDARGVLWWAGCLWAPRGRACFVMYARVLHMAFLLLFVDTATADSTVLAAQTEQVRIVIAKQWHAEDMAAFQTAVAMAVDEYCVTNYTLCALDQPIANGSFTARHVAPLDNYPHFEEMYAIEIRFVVMYPAHATMGQPVRRSLMEREHLSTIIAMYKMSIEHYVGWSIVTYEIYPKFEKITTFMNYALIPIGLTVGLAMYGLAHWASTIGYSYGPDMVIGSSGGTNDAAVRVKQMIERQAKQEHALADRKSSCEDTLGPPEGAETSTSLHQSRRQSTIVDSNARQLYAHRKSLSIAHHQRHRASTGQVKRAARGQNMFFAAVSKTQRTPH